MIPKAPTNPSSTAQPPRIVPTEHGYDLWSSTYDTDGNPLIGLEESWVDRLLPLPDCARLIDIGCGTGRHAVRLAARAAESGKQIKITAVDFSEGMLAKAKSKPHAKAVTWVRHDLAQPLPFAPASFDIALCALVLDHVHDLPSFFSHARRVCVPNTPLLITVMHPAMMLKGVQARFHDAATGEEVRPQSAPNQISHYVMSAQAAGWTIDHMQEHLCDDALAASHPRAAKYLNWPMLLTLRLRA